MRILEDLNSEGRFVFHILWRQDSLCIVEVNYISLADKGTIKFDVCQMQKGVILHMLRMSHVAILHLPIQLYCMILLDRCGPGSLVGIPTSYGPDGPGIESRRGRDFPHLSRPALRPTQLPVQWVRDLSRG
jgi:hypothetical protein